MDTSLGCSLWQERMLSEDSRPVLLIQEESVSLDSAGAYRQVVYSRTYIFAKGITNASTASTRRPSETCENLRCLCDGCKHPSVLRRAPRDPSLNSSRADLSSWPGHRPMNSPKNVALPPEPPIPQLGSDGLLKLEGPLRSYRLFL